MSHRTMTNLLVTIAFAAGGWGSTHLSSAVTPYPYDPDEEGQQSAVVLNRLQAEELREYQRPTARYTEHSCVIDLSKYAELSLHGRVRGCGTTVTFSTQLMRMSVPDSWGAWSCPPQSESCTPNVMYSNHAVAATIDFGTVVKTGGFEYSPARFQVERVRVAFFTGPFGSGDLVGAITRNVDGDGGARLFGGRAASGFRSAVVTNDSDDDFAIAQIRVSHPSAPDGMRMP